MPFECVGTFEEVNYAICKTISNFENGLIDDNAKEYEGVRDDLPYLLNYYKENYGINYL